MGLYASSPLEAMGSIARMSWTPLGIVALLILVGGFLIHAKINKSDIKHKELITAQAELTAAETKNRKMERDKQLDLMRSDYRERETHLEKRLDDLSKIIDGVGKALDRHTDDHKERDSKLERTLDSISARIGGIEKNHVPRSEFSDMYNKVTNMDKSLVEAVTMLKFITKDSANKNF
jgi:hypothetical protein